MNPSGACTHSVYNSVMSSANEVLLYKLSWHVRFKIYLDINSLWTSDAHALVNQVIIGSDNGLVQAPVQCQAII